jgi:hypothetical protein
MSPYVYQIISSDVGRRMVLHLGAKDVQDLGDGYNQDS